MDILRRIRIVECGLAVAKSMGGARYRTTPALQNEWAQRLGFDVADFEAITHVGGAGGPRMLWSVAVLRSHAERNAWAQAQRRAHPYLRVLNATSKAHPLADMVRHYDALGLRCEWRLSYGQIAWFLTYLRFLVQVLVADADYGMLLNDDVEIGDDFDRALEALVLRLERPEHAARKYASYRLGKNDAGLIIPRAAAARILGIACDETLIALQTDQWQVSKELQSHGSCRFTYNGTPFEGLVTRGEINTHTSIQSWGVDISARDERTFFSGVAAAAGRAAPPGSFCASIRAVWDPSLLRVDYVPGFAWDGLGSEAFRTVPKARSTQAGTGLNK